jgi:hypothetical protein
VGDGSRSLAEAGDLDRAGREAEAIPRYRDAIACGLPEADLPRAYLGLGSSLRLVGEHAEAVRVLREGVARCGGHGPLRVFLAFALWDAGARGDALVELVEAALAAPGSPDLEAYAEPMRRYAGELADR